MSQLRRKQSLHCFVLAGPCHAMLDGMQHHHAAPHAAALAFGGGNDYLMA